MTTFYHLMETMNQMKLRKPHLKTTRSQEALMMILFHLKEVKTDLKILRLSEILMTILFHSKEVKTNSTFKMNLLKTFQNLKILRLMKSLMTIPGLGKAHNGCTPAPKKMHDAENQLRRTEHGDRQRT